MKTRVGKTWDPLADSFQLTKQEIESQVLIDLSRYRKKYQKQYDKPAPVLLDVDNFVYELWEFSISVENISQDNENEEVLGFLRPETRQVVIDEKCTNQKRVSFTIGHEAGHLSLHGPLFRKKNGVIVGWSNTSKSANCSEEKLEGANRRREWQANVYAGALLAPEMDIHDLLEELGLIKNSILLPFNLNDHAQSFETRFGLSRQALEIRLDNLEIPFQGAKYKTV